MSERAVLRFALLLAVVCASGCSTFGWGKSDSESPNIDLIAVVPLRESPGQPKRGERPPLESHAGKAVTGQIYGYLAAQTRYRFVPDLTIDALVARIDAADRLAAARALAQESGANAVLFGSVYRFQERVGPRYAASQPASVSFELELFSVAADEVVWSGQFDETQEALSTNLLNAWMFWRVGPHWFSVRELSGVGVEKLLKTLPK